MFTQFCECTATDSNKIGLHIYLKPSGIETLLTITKLSIKWKPKESWTAPSCGMLRCMALVRIDVSEETITSIISVTKIGELGTTLALNTNRDTLVVLRSLLQLLVTVNVRSSP
jgi:hypothetical protein